MNILVCVRRVPDPAENEIRLNSAGKDIERDDLVYTINEWDNYAVEEALQITSRVGGEVTVVTVGSEEDEDVLRRELAMGAKHAVLLADEGSESTDARSIAEMLRAFVQRHSFDLILTGVQAEAGGAQIGGMLAALLDYPYASLVTSIEVAQDAKLKVAREIAGGHREVSEIDRPCVLSIQTGINEPRYVGMRGIRQVAAVEIPIFNASDLRVAPSLTARVHPLDYFTPAAGRSAEMLTGDRDGVVAELVERLKSHGGLSA